MPGVPVLLLGLLLLAPGGRGVGVGPGDVQEAHQGEVDQVAEQESHLDTYVNRYSDLDMFPGYQG